VKRQGSSPVFSLLSSLLSAREPVGRISRLRPAEIDQRPMGKRNCVNGWKSRA
jgi:hypothetical protein